MVVVPRKVRTKDKIVPEAKVLANILQGLRSQGKTVVLTNGVYDLLHVGHVRCLEDARARGDFLVVALNSDKSAESLKGKGHPVVPLEERMEVLAALWFVDYVTSFDAPTADDLLLLLRPDAYAKGTEYAGKALPEKDSLRQIGVKPVFVGDKKTHSSSKLIQKIKKKRID